MVDLTNSRGLSSVVNCAEALVLCEASFIRSVCVLGHMQELVKLENLGTDLLC